VETTLSMQQPRAVNTAQRLRWQAKNENETKVAATGLISTGGVSFAPAQGTTDSASDGAGAVSVVCSVADDIELAPLDIRAYVLSAAPSHP
jgi:hypothetical protein